MSDSLHFCGHVDGDEKRDRLRAAKLLINTSIWEGIPVSWLEALSYGTLIVSSFDRDGIVERFGSYVGEVMGDGLDENSIRKYARAVEYWMTHDAEREETALKATGFIEERHMVERFVRDARALILRSIL